ncbi:hypothetical protein HMI55_000099 [Coelomomyces lativittatus]|nr:hypothetical protein HMI55_000099 [Coelomomyces lativittatus]
MDIIGSFNADDLSTNLFSWSLLNNVILRISQQQLAGSSASYCFTFSGNYGSTNSRVIINFGSHSCEKPVLVPSNKLPCVRPCVLDNNFANGICEPCSATCYSGAPSQLTATQKCTLKVLTPAVGSNAPFCTTTTSRICSKTCSVDCTVSGPFYKECLANCATQTTIHTGYYVTNPPLNGGTPCSLTETTTTKTCTLPLSKKTECNQNCRVTGVPYINCRRICSATPRPTNVVTYPFPTTLQPPVGTGSPCPSWTATCSCERTTCSLGPSPTSTFPCDATCTAFDGSYAKGYQKAIYPILGNCANTSYNSTKYVPCFKECPCSYYASSAVGSCIPTSTITSTTPWVVTGFQKFTALASATKCNTIVDMPCSTVLRPTDCSVLYECPSCSCTSTSGSGYWMTDTLTCKINTLTPSQFSGRPCPTTSSISCNQYCPGCDYFPPICQCSYTFTTTNGATTTYGGYKYCTQNTIFKPDDANGLLQPLTTNPCPFVLTTEYPKSQCTSLLTGSESCLYQTKSCDSLSTFTSTATTVTPWTLYGYLACTLTDKRPLNSQPSTCTPFTSTISVSSTTTQIPCTVTSVCLKPSPPDCYSLSQGFNIVTQTCLPVTVAGSSCGAKYCSQSVNPTKVTSVYCFKNTPSPVAPRCFCEGSEFNAVFFGNVNASCSYVEGRLSVRGNATLINFNIGEKLSSVQTCNLYPKNALIVGGNLYHYGKVSNGNLMVSGSCGDGTVLSCDGLCNQPSCLMSENFSIEECVRRLQLALGNLKPNTLVAPPIVPMPMTNLEAIIQVTWSGTLLEVIEVPSIYTMASSLINIVTLQFLGTLNPKATIVINIRGSVITVPAFTMDQLKGFASNIIYNFVDATSINFLPTDLYGTVLARNATISGSSTIYGQVFAGSMIPSGDASLKFKYVKYNGYCANNGVYPLPSDGVYI